MSGGAKDIEVRGKSEEKRGKRQRRCVAA